MHPRLRIALVTTVASVLAVYLGSEIASAEYAWPALAAVLIIATVLVRFLKIPADAIFIGFLLIGYIVGNRGFAQLMPIRGLPLLPAETGLLVAVSWRLVICAFRRELPFRNDALNVVLLAWLVVGGARVVFDVPRYGLLAVRDFAMVYYVVFFFVVQHMARDAATRRFFTNCLVLAFSVLVPVFMLYLSFPNFFLNELTVAGTPLIFHKGDLAVTFLAVGALLLFHWAGGLRRYWAWPLVVAMTALIATGGNRASMLGLAIVTGLLALARHWRFPLLQGGLATAGLLALVFLSAVFNHTWSQQKLHSFSDQARSVIDIAGTGNYQSQDSFQKGDNNKFRLVWWRNVMQETWASNPAFGLGFGADLAQGFVQEYYPDADEEFTTRSPHNMAVTTFGRMGLAGTVVWLAFCGIIIGRTWRALRYSSDPVIWSLWCGVCAILCSSFFGVVLEGPMGAVVFWTVLGLASASAAPRETPEGKAVTDATEPAEIAELPAL